MPSKGVQVYCYICVPGCQVDFTVPGQTITKTDLGRWTSDHLEVDKAHIHGAFSFTGQFSFKVTRNGQELTSQWVDINTMTGNLEKGTMKSMADQTSFVTNELIVTYLFYDAGHGEAGLPNAHQCLVTVSPNAANWQGEVAPPGTDKAGKPFRKFVLPAAHDIGMNSMETPDAVIQSAGKPFVTLMKQSSNAFNKLADNATSGVIAAIAPNIIAGLAVTQKDTLDVVLTIGARYFEFRPAHIHARLREYNCVPDSLYFTHGPIPGMLYDKFLHDLVAFLMAHPTEIVVVQLRWDGVPAECAHPSDDELNKASSEALQQANGSINIGNLDDMQNQSIESLRNSGKRLILLNSVDSFSTYTDEGNATLNGDSIIQEYESLSTDKQNGHAFTNIQCQATASNIRDVVIYSALSADVSNSCLMATKPICDSKTLPWIRQHALEKLQADQLVLIMNDFFDGATADVGIDLSRRRLDG
jgi:hypothetical protein